MGAFNNYVDMILPFFDPPPVWTYPERGQKQTFFDPLPPPHLVHVVIKWPPIEYHKFPSKDLIDLLL